jgi:small subunit ribosomal protein S19e
MTTAYDVPAKELIDALAKKLRSVNVVVPPEWSDYVRTSVSRENPPEKMDWWYTRCASILRKIYIHNSVGVERLRSEYGGKRDRGSKPYKARGGSGSVIRKALQQLEKAGFVMKIRGKGRVLTPKGRSLLDNTAFEVKESIIEDYPELKKY